MSTSTPSSSEPAPLVIVNPASRSGSGASRWPHAASALRSHFGPFDCAFTAARGDATRLAREARESGRTLVLTFGGDGTISETARGLVEADARQPCALGILPHGTGGDLVRSLGLPTSIAEAAKILKAGRTLEVDVGCATLENGDVRTFVNAASFGLSAAVAQRVNRPRARSYFRETATAALHFRAPEIELSVNDGPRQRIAITSVSVHNGRFFGGGMEMAPNARLDDGKLELVVVKKLSLRKLLSRAPLLYWGAHQGLAEVEHGPVDRVEAWPGEACTVPLEIDGETGYRLPARFDLGIKKLSIRVGTPD